MYCTYKWALRMPLYTKEISQYLNDLEIDHLDNIMNGKDVILLSRRFSDSDSDGGDFYFLLNFDFDYHGKYGANLDIKTVLKSVKLLSDVLTYLKVDHYFENSPNGVHVVSTDAYKTNQSEFTHFRMMNDKTITECVKRYPGLDSNYMIPRGVVHRFGSYINGKTIQRWDDYDNLKENFQSVGTPESIMTKDSWMNEFKHKLFPKIFSLRNASEILKNIFSV